MHKEYVYTFIAIKSIFLSSRLSCCRCNVTARIQNPIYGKEKAQYKPSGSSLNSIRMFLLWYNSTRLHEEIRGLLQRQWFPNIVASHGLLARIE